MHQTVINPNGFYSDYNKRDLFSRTLNIFMILLFTLF
jgi:hypothetical protein